VIQDENMSMEDAREKAHMLRKPQDKARLPGYVLTWADPPSHQEEGKRSRR
jgi:hypothetical protein